MLTHISDFHASTFGETFHDRAHFTKRSQQPLIFSEKTHDILGELNGFRVLTEKSGKPKEKGKEKLILIDSQGYEYTIPVPAKSPKKGTQPAISHALDYASMLYQRSFKRLAQELPNDDKLQSMLSLTPTNTNLRLIRSARAVIATNPDLILMTGDLTDNGEGYEIIETIFEPWKKTGRLLAVPGNHDLYLFPFGGGVVRPRPTHESKRKDWQAFAKRLGLNLDPTGAWVKEFPECRAIFVGFDSCAMGQSRFMLHSGAIGQGQLKFLRSVARTPEWKNASHRIVAMHHHLVPLPLGVGRSAPTEIGMRLEDAPEVAEVLNEVGATFVMHGHRHLSEARQPANCNFQLLSAPSLTLGCRSGDVPSYWRIELDEEYARWQRIRLSLPAVDPALDDPNLVEV